MRVFHFWLLHLQFQIYKRFTGEDGVPSGFVCMLNFIIVKRQFFLLYTRGCCSIMPRNKNYSIFPLKSTLLKPKYYLFFNFFRMKKVAPEVRMTEAARKRSAKIRQDKASAENAKPVSPRLRQQPLSGTTAIPRAKSLSSEKSKQVERYVKNMCLCSLFNCHLL